MSGEVTRGAGKDSSGEPVLSQQNSLDRVEVQASQADSAGVPSCLRGGSHFLFQVSVLRNLRMFYSTVTAYPCLNPITYFSHLVLNASMSGSAKIFRKL